MHHGESLAFGAFSYAPSLEVGVVCLFGAMAADLGFVIESFSPRFPDCYAKRRIILPSGETRWQSCRIEFEYRSSNFALHKHDPAGADLIVCWEHDDPNTQVHVLELKRAVEVLDKSRVAPWSPSAAYHPPAHRTNTTPDRPTRKPQDQTRMTRSRSSLWEVIGREHERIGSKQPAAPHPQHPVRPLRQWVRRPSPRKHGQVGGRLGSWTG